MHEFPVRVYWWSSFVKTIMWTKFQVRTMISLEIWTREKKKKKKEFYDDFKGNLRRGRPILLLLLIYNIHPPTITE